MNTLTRLTLSVALTAFWVSATARAEPAGAAESISIAEEAYLYGFPMIIGYGVLHSYFLDSDSGQFKAPVGQLHNEARVFTPKDTGISTPNSDTPYSMALLDLRAEPYVLCVPEIEKARYYDVQLVDLYSDNYGYMGSRTTGNGAGCFLVAGPDWKGEAPTGIKKVFHCETQFSLVIIRTQLFNADDMENVKKIQAGYKVQPLSAFLDKPAPPAAPAIEWPKFEKSAMGAAFPRYLSFLLQFCPPVGTAAVEKPLRERLAGIGIGGDAKASDNPEEAQTALGPAIKSAQVKIEQACEHVGARVNGWQIGAAAGDRDFYDGNWALRAAAAKLGIYGNSEAEAVYPFTREDVKGVPLDGSKHTYQMTFPAGQLPPVKAFWSITMYDGGTQLLIDNPIDRYLINSPMLDQLKKNPDGSISIYIQRDSPGKEKESNWLPAPDGPMFVVMRLYWPKTEPPSVLPTGKGTWQPPGIVPIANLDAEKVRRSGDKSVENTVRTDDRYGGDPFFYGPRGWPYWNYLEYPKPIQNPNLWPDLQSSYFLSQFKLPAGCSLTLRGSYPHVRYMKFALYRWENNTFVSIGEDLEGKDILPDKGATNPFKIGANRLGDQRDFTLTIIADDPPEDVSKREPNTLYVGKDGRKLQMVLRIYLPDQGWDGAGWGPEDEPSRVRGLPIYEGMLADGTKLDATGVIERFALPMDQATKQPVTDAQWIGLVNAPGNDPATAPARKEPRWEKYWNFNYSIVGSFKSPEERGKMSYSGPMDGGGDPATQYLYLFLSRKFGPVYVMRGRMPTFPNTFAGSTGKGLEIMPDAQTQYFSLVSCEAAPSGQIVDGLMDMQIPLDENGNYTIVYSRKEDRPKNATEENGVAWIEWSPRGEGIDSPKNREDFGMLMLRIMATNPEWKERPDNITKPGEEEAVMGPYYPHGHYTTKEAFEAEKQ